MYPYQYIVPNNKSMFRNKTNNNNFINTYPTNITPTDDRFFFAPFLVGGLAGTALGYGIANNNQLNNGNNMPIYGPIYPIYPPYPTFPTYTSTTNHY